jgi:hypothetical protein
MSEANPKVIDRPATYSRWTFAPTSAELTLRFGA